MTRLEAPVRFEVSDLGLAVLDFIAAHATEQSTSASSEERPTIVVLTSRDRVEVESAGVSLVDVGAD